MNRMLYAIKFTTVWCKVLINILIKCNYFTGNIKFMLLLHVSPSIIIFNVILMQLSHAPFHVCLCLCLCASVLCIEKSISNSLSYSFLSARQTLCLAIICSEQEIYSHTFSLCSMHISVAYQKIGCIAFCFLYLFFSHRISLRACITHFYFRWNQKFISKWGAYGLLDIYTAYSSAYGKFIFSMQRNEMIPRKPSVIIGWGFSTNKVKTWLTETTNM